MWCLTGLENGKQVVKRTGVVGHKSLSAKRLVVESLSDIETFIFKALLTYHWLYSTWSFWLPAMLDLVDLDTLQSLLLSSSLSSLTHLILEDVYLDHCQDIVQLNVLGLLEPLPSFQHVLNVALLLIKLPVF